MIRRTRSFRQEMVINRPVDEVFHLVRVPWHPQLRELVDLSPPGEEYSQWRLRVGRRMWIEGRVVDQDPHRRWVTRSGCRGVDSIAEIRLESDSEDSTRYVADGSVTTTPRSAAFWFLSGRTAGEAADAIARRWEAWTQTYDGPLPVPPDAVIASAGGGGGGGGAAERARGLVVTVATFLLIGIVGDILGAAWWLTLLASLVAWILVIRLLARSAVQRMIDQ
jgi:uncharacterized protein YndB with AHSA1/START domain